jgi:hypothetical protein
VSDEKDELILLNPEYVNKVNITGWGEYSEESLEELRKYNIEQNRIRKSFKYQFRQFIEKIKHLRLRIVDIRDYEDFN